MAKDTFFSKDCLGREDSEEVDYSKINPGQALGGSWIKKKNKA